ncbi:MAG: peptidylprolyl isomerase, partial [Methylobacterium sp.]
MTVRSSLARLTVGSVIAISCLTGVGISVVPAMAASEISVVVNKQPITTYQIQQRAAFLKLRRVPGADA